MLKRIFVFIFSFLIISSAYATEPIKYKLDNGLTVIINEMPSSATTSINVWVKTGSANEGKYLGSGITHFVEHMLFKGTPTRPVGRIPEEVKEMGGKTNASTSYDYTVFFIDIPTASLNQGIDLMADMIFNARMDADDVNKERDVIVNEMRMVNDNPDRQLGYLAYETVFLRHPYQHPIIGYRDLFTHITHDELVDYYHTWYVPNNIILSIAGNVNVDELKPLIESTFGQATQGIFPTRHLPIERDQIARRWAEREYNTELTRLSINYLGVSIMNHDVYALDVLAMALGQGSSSRLYQSVYKEKELVSSIGASNLTPLDKGSFEIEATLKEGVTVEEVISAVEEEINLIKKKGLNKNELAKVKRQVMADSIYGRQQASGVARRAAIEEAFVGDPTFSDKYDAQVSKIANEDIIRVANKYLTSTNQSIAVLRPTDWQREDVTDHAQTKTDVEKITLSNGARLLIKQDNSLPIVVMQLAMEAGFRHETQANLGIGNLTASLWRRGVKGKTANQIDQEIESRAMNLGMSMGNNSLNLAMTMLADDTDVGFSYLNDFLKRPTFPQDELNLIKQSSKEAIKLRRDSIASMTFKTMREALFLEHPYRFDSLGTEQTINAITRDDIINHFNQYVAPNNMVIAVYGDINCDHVVAKLEQIIGTMKPKDIMLGHYHEPPVTEMREAFYNMDKEQAMLVAGFLGPDLYNEDMYATQMITSIMGASLNGRLFKTIREEKGKAYSTHAGSGQTLDSGMVYFYVLTDPDNVNDVRSLLIEQIELMKKGFTDKEIADAKMALKSQHAMDLDTIGAQASSAVYNELYGLGYDYYTLYDQKIDAVTPEKLQQIVEQYFNLNQMTMAITKPEDKK